MAKDVFKITIHMVSSLDGYIAKKDNSVSWFETSDNYEDRVTWLSTDLRVIGSHRKFKISTNEKENIDHPRPYHHIRTWIRFQILDYK
jgi:hypothetical protein